MKSKQGLKKIMAAGMLATLAVGTLGATAAFAGNSDDDAPLHNLNELKEAVDADDYNAFLEALEDIDEKAAEHMNEEVFDRIVEMHDLREDINEAVATGTYDEWVALVSELPNGEALINTIDEDEFDTLRELNEARDAKDRETVIELSHELGLDEMREANKEIREEKREERMERRADINSALEAEDYQAWLLAIAESPMEEALGDVITEENFADLVEIHDLREAGEHGEAREAAQELGLPEPEHRLGKMMHKLRGRFIGLFR